MTKEIPSLNLKAQYLSIQPEIDTAITRVLVSGQFILGQEVSAFEREFAEYCKHMIENDKCEYYLNFKQKGKLSVEAKKTILKSPSKKGG